MRYSGEFLCLVYSVETEDRAYLPDSDTFIMSTTLLNLEEAIDKLVSSEATTFYYCQTTLGKLPTTSMTKSIRSFLLKPQAFYRLPSKNQ